MELATTVPAAGGGLQLLSSGEPVAKPASLATQTAAVGVITPPPDIRSIVVSARQAESGASCAFLSSLLTRWWLQDKTAQFVARNGVEFERRRVPPRDQPYGEARSPLLRSQHPGEREEQCQVQLPDSWRPVPRLLPTQGARRQSAAELLLTSLLAR